MPRFLSRLALAALLAASVTGCRDALSAHADVAAEAAGQSLPAQRLADLMINAKGLTIGTDAARDIANFWIDFTLFSQAIAEGEVFRDSATIAEAMWRELTDLKAEHWYDTLSARRSDITPAMVEAIYGGDSLRIVQHILVRLPQGAPAADSAAARQQVDALFRETRGADATRFGALARDNSADPGSARDSGYLPPSGRGAFVTAFDSAAWTLGPGQLSGIVSTPYGYHLLRRPTLLEAGPRLEAFLARESTRSLDQGYIDSLATANNLDVKADAPALMRQAAEDPSEWEASKKALATFKDGRLSVADYLQWLRALPPPYMMQVRSATDENLSAFAKALASNVLLVRQADSAGITVTAGEWADVRTEYLARLDTVSALLGLTAEVRDSSATLETRSRLAATLVDEYISRIASGTARLRPLPSQSFAANLRQRYDYHLNPAGLQRAADLAQAARQAIIDSTGVDPKAAPPPPVMPGALDSAAGPPPVGEGQ